jgi:hypothetical protein
MGGLDVDIASMTTVAAIGRALGEICLTQEGDATVSTSASI